MCSKILCRVFELILIFILKWQRQNTVHASAGAKEQSVDVSINLNKSKTMPTRTDTVEDILNQIKQLNYAEKIDILEKVVLLIKSGNKQQVKLSSISGLGSEIWQNVDIGNYIQNERQWD